MLSCKVALLRLLMTVLQAEKWTYDAEKNLLIPRKGEQRISYGVVADDSEEGE